MKQYQKGIILIIASAAFFSLMSLFVKLSGDLPSIQKSFFRNFVAAIFAFILLLRSGEGFSFQRRNLPFLLLRSIFGTVGILCNFYAVDHLVLSDASMLNKMSPFFAVLCSIFFLREKARPFQIAAIAAAFAGTLFIIRPTFSNMQLVPSLIGLLGGFGAGVAYTTVRYLGQRGERGPLVVFFFSAFSCLFCLPFLIADYAHMTLWQFAMLMLAGLAAAGGQFTITAAYFYAPASQISIYDYTQIIFSTLWSFLFFSQIPDLLSVAGYFIICGAAVFNFLMSRHKIHGQTPGLDDSDKDENNSEDGSGGDRGGDRSLGRSSASDNSGNRSLDMYGGSNSAGDRSLGRDGGGNRSAGGDSEEEKIPIKQ